MERETFVLGELQTNCYLLSNPLSAEAIIIDPADDGDWLNEELLRRNLKLVAVLLSHAHFDHCLGLLSLKLAWQMPIYLHQADWPLLEKAQDSAKHWLKREVDPIPSPDISLEDDHELSLAGQTFRVVHTPGHTPGSVGFLLIKDKIYFSGDTIFKDGIGSTNHHYSSRKDLYSSLERIRQLGEEREISEVFAGHGESFFL